VKPDPAPARSTALVAVPAREASSVWDDVRLQKLWLAIERRPWRSVAVIGASKSVETIQLAELLAQLAWRYRGQPSAVCDLRELSMRLVDYQIQEMRAQVESGVRLVVSLRSVFGKSDLRSGRKTDGRRSSLHRARRDQAQGG